MKRTAYRVNHPRGDKIVFNGTTAGLYAAAGYIVERTTVEDNEN